MDNMQNRIVELMSLFSRTDIYDYEILDILEEKLASILSELEKAEVKG